MKINYSSLMEGERDGEKDREEILRERTGEGGWREREGEKERKIERER